MSIKYQTRFKESTVSKLLAIYQAKENRYIKRNGFMWLEKSIEKQKIKDEVRSRKLPSRLSYLQALELDP
jgi:hypothetical protein